MLPQGRSERDVETRFLIEKLVALYGDGGMSVLDVGFAGAWYIDDILEIGDVAYVGMDSDEKRISGEGLLTTKDKKKLWRDTLEKIEYVTEDITDGGYKEKHDVVISVSTIEHIVPFGYANSHAFGPDLDVKAVEAMKCIATDSVILTFPCGIEKRFYGKKNRHVGVLESNGFVKSGHDIVIFDERKIQRMIGDWNVHSEAYWINYGKGFFTASKEEALSYSHKDSTAASICGLVLTRR